MHTFLLVCRITVLGWPHQRLSPPTYWFIRGDLEPRCHMLPQMGNFPQAIQAPWQQAWTIMDAKDRERERALSGPRTTQAACTFTYVDYRSCALYAGAWFCMMHTFVCAIPHVLAYPMWARNSSCTCIFTACINALRAEQGDESWMQGGAEGKGRHHQPSSDR